MKVTELMRDLSKGPLESYRKRASFDWKSMKLNLYGKEYLNYQDKLFKLMELSPEFQKPIKSLTLDETRRRCISQMRVLANNDLAMPQGGGSFNVMFAYDGSLPIITGLSYGMVPGVVMSLGSERHVEYLEKFMSGEKRSFLMRLRQFLSDWDATSHMYRGWKSSFFKLLKDLNSTPSNEKSP